MKNRLFELRQDWERREQDRLSNSELARLTGVSRDTIVRMIKDDDTSISSQTIKDLCKFFKIQPGELLYIEYEPNEIAG